MKLHCLFTITNFTRIVRLSVLTFLIIVILPQIVRCQFPDPRNLAMELAKKELKHQARMLIASQVPKLIESEIPLDLDRAGSFSKAEEPENFSFSPINLGTVSDLNRPLKDGDYRVNLIFYCVQWGHHRPSNGHPYKLARAKGKMSMPISALLFKGSISHIPRDVLLGTAWLIQSGINYEGMPSLGQQTINTVIPEFKNKLVGDGYDQLIAKINKDVASFNSRFKQNFNFDFNEAINEVIHERKTTVKVQQELTTALLLLNFRKLITMGAIRVDNMSQDQYLAIGGALPMQLDPYSGTQLSEWNDIQPGVKGRFTIQGGFLKNNLLEFRVRNSEGQQDKITLNAILNGSGADAGNCLMAYPIDASTEAQIPCLAADLDNCPKLPQVNDIILYRHFNDPIHAGVVTAVDANGKVLEVLSKFGSFGTYLHRPNDIYKNETWEIWHTDDENKNLERKTNNLSPVDFYKYSWWADDVELSHLFDWGGGFSFGTCKLQNRPSTDDEVKALYRKRKCFSLLEKMEQQKVKLVSPPSCEYNCFGLAFANDILMLRQSAIDKILNAKHFCRVYVEINQDENGCPVD